MREDNELVHYVPILRRIIVLVAVIIAVPVVLWTITLFVRAYVAPAKVPTFHQLAATASFNTSHNSISPHNSISTRAAADRPAQGEQAKPSGPPPAETEAKTMVANASNSSVAPKGPLLSESGPQTVASVPPPSAMKTVNMAAAAPAGVKWPDVSSTPPAPKWPEVSTVPPAAAPAPTPSESAAPAGLPKAAATLAEQQQPAAGAESGADDLPAAAPLKGPIPLPRRRPRDANTMRIADMAPSSVPIPRPRPGTAGPGAPSEKSESPIGFIQNLFH